MRHSVSNIDMFKHGSFGLPPTEASAEKSSSQIQDMAQNDGQTFSGNSYSQISSTSTRTPFKDKTNRQEEIDKSKLEQSNKICNIEIQTIKYPKHVKRLSKGSLKTPVNEDT
jgi:hypothetical protein